MTILIHLSKNINLVIRVVERVSSLRWNSSELFKLVSKLHIQVVLGSFEEVRRAPEHGRRYITLIVLTTYSDDDLINFLVAKPIIINIQINKRKKKEPSSDQTNI